MFTFSGEVRAAYESMPIPLAYYQNIDGRPVAILVSDGLCRMMKADRDRLISLLNDSLLERVHPDDAGKLQRVIGEFKDHLCGYDVIYRSKYATDDEYHLVHSSASWHIMPDGTELAVFIYSDISESEGESRKIAESYEIFQRDNFYTDQLTGLPNANFLRVFAEQKVDSLRLRGKIPALVYIDVISLGSYNTRYGYHEGDEFLLLIADILKNDFPGSLIIRGADDQFILITECRENISSCMEEANRKVIAGAYGNTRGIKAGICRYEDDMSTSAAIDHARQVLKRIDMDLNICCDFYSPAREQDYLEQRYIVDSLNKALEYNWIRVYYQAIMRLKTDKACALEALARWIDPVRGTLSPARFIPVLKEYHLLHKLDLYMVEQVCREISLREAGELPIIPVTVNFSAQDFDYIHVAEELNRILEHYQVSHNLLIIEITEQDLAIGTESFRQQLRELRENGYHLWLDDFGSGYSSLSVLSQFEFDMLKFDMELLRHYDVPANRYIMEAMVNLARKLNIQTLSEGIEVADQKDFLNQIGCQLAQGYYFYKPHPLEDILTLVKEKGKPMECETPEERQVYLQEWYDNH